MTTAGSGSPESAKPGDGPRFHDANQAEVSASVLRAFAACSSVMAPALTISSIRFSFGIAFSDFFALRIFWLDDGRASL